MDILTWLGFLLATIAYLALTLLSCIGKNKNLPHRVFILFSSASLIWGATHLLAEFSLINETIVNWAESIRIAITCILLFSMLNKTATAKTLLTNQYTLGISLVAICIPLFSHYNIISPALFFIGYLALTVAALIFLEILYRRAAEELWGLKPLILGLGTLLIFDFIVFADASLVIQINNDMWLARGYLHTALVPLLLWSVKRSKSLGIKVYISREMVFQSSLLIAAGFYLCLMAIVGFYIKSIESQWTGMIQSIFIALAFTILFALFISETLKRNFKVFLEKNFFANQFDYRVRWLNLTNLLNLPLDEDNNFYDRSLQAFLYSTEYDSGMLIKLKKGTPELASYHYPKTTEQYKNIPANSSCDQVLDLVIPFIQKKHWIVDLKDYQSNSQNYPGLHISYELIESCSYHVIIPIYQEAELWGVVCLNNLSGEQLIFNWEIRDYMTVVTNQVGHYIFQHEAMQLITENAQFAAFSRMSAFVIHDLKNVLSQVDMILSNAEKHKHNPDFIDDTFETLGYTKQRMEKMLSQLMNKSVEENISVNKLNIGDLLRQLIKDKCLNILPKPKVIELETVELSLDSEKFSNIMYHLIDNAQQATPDDGEVSISINRSENNLIIELKDNGCGMSSEFIRDKLFKPFVTTKGNAGMGIGAYDAQLYVEQAGGHLKVDSVEDVGTRFTIQLPIN
ncbi:XrtA/PEP-CTERM system histidine kinase PrsK [Catenovulum maritimum]|uniref:histidine kinase n=1 Tax=Catenovulum maritimum TaxID=1513271 RepID=A0A0J8GTI2_9ALTE|nr:XrtA/PEP-CTERM system histidine kinase PrsK [Catenovulum maritimum]KMT64619.1 hypothetical protein XM47_13330 [Catenovulum maritimum]